jgi:hypothetical protein
MSDEALAKLETCAAVNSKSRSSLGNILPSCAARSREGTPAACIDGPRTRSWN